MAAKRLGLNPALTEHGNPLRYFLIFLPLLHGCIVWNFYHKEHIFFKHKDTKTTFFNAENAKKNAKDTEIFLIVFFTPFRDSNPDRGRYPTQQRAFAAVNHHSTINNHHSKAVHSSINNNQSSFESEKLPRRGYTFVARGKRPQGSATPG